MMHKTWVEISKSALHHNVGQFLSLLPRGVQFMAVVKSNAYGHGLAETTRIVHEYKTNGSRIWFGVDNLDEAAVVHKIASRSPVLVLGYTQNERLKEAIKLGARLTVYNWETIRALKRCQVLGVRFQVHVKVETGTTRQGIGEAEAVEYVKALKKLRGVEVEGISTHFADSEDTRSDYAIEQLARYNSVIERLARAGLHVPVRHLACTAATLRYPKSHGNLVRVGIGMYGLWPAEAVRQLSLRGAKRRGNPSFLQNQRSPRALQSLAMTRQGIDLKPVLTWKTIVAQVKKVKKGTSISYDRTERATRESRVAVLPVGYWDGYDRGLSRTGHVLLNGRRCKVLGRVCMNMTMVDITNAGAVAPENEVVLLGRQGTEEINAEEFADKLGTINYEVVTRINPLLPRIIAR